MGGPAQQTSLDLVVPPGEAQVLYAPGVLAQKVQNFEVTQEGTIKSVIGPCPYEQPQSPPGDPNTIPNDEEGPVVTAEATSFSGTPLLPKGRPYGIYHDTLDGGLRDVLIARSGTRLYRHCGWKQAFEQIWPRLDSSGTEMSQDESLSVTDSTLYPDQFLTLHNKIIWTNGVDRARMILSDGSVFPLGYTTTPGAPTTQSPSYVAQEDNLGYANMQGYSWPGKIGTHKVDLDGIAGAIGAGAWYYYVQWEDVAGNLSPLSPKGSPATLAVAQATPFSDNIVPDEETGVTVDDLMKQFLVRTTGQAPRHTKATRIYRTADTLNGGSEPRFVTRLSSHHAQVYPDNIPDAYLGLTAIDAIPVPVFRVMCAHQGRLVIGNLEGAPGMIRRSEPGLPGTFERSEWIIPDSGGAEVTAVTSHNGQLYAFTDSSVYAMHEFGIAQPVAQGIGCVAPRSIQALADGTLIWLARDGFYGITPGGPVTRMSVPIDRVVKDYLNKSRMNMAVATVDKRTGEYRCAVTRAGESENKLILCFDGRVWRRIDLGIQVNDMCTTKDWRRYLLLLGQRALDLEEYTPWLEKHGYMPFSYYKVSKPAGTDSSGAMQWAESYEEKNLWVMDREIQDYPLPDRDIIYRSGWMRGDEIGLQPLNVRNLYIGMLDIWDGDFTIRFYRNGSWDEYITMTDVRAIGVDDESGIVTDIAGEAVIGQAKTRDPRLFWRQVPVGLENAYSWAFEIRASHPTRLHIAAFSFEVNIASMGASRGRVPRRADK